MSPYISRSISPRCVLQKSLLFIRYCTVDISLASYERNSWTFLCLNKSFLLVVCVQLYRGVMRRKVGRRAGYDLHLAVVKGRFHLSRPVFFSPRQMKGIEYRLYQVKERIQLFWKIPHMFCQFFSYFCQESTTTTSNSFLI